MRLWSNKEVGDDKMAWATKLSPADQQVHPVLPSRFCSHLLIWASENRTRDAQAASWSEEEMRASKKQSKAIVGLSEAVLTFQVNH
jgi:hypothetical protein